MKKSLLFCIAALIVATVCYAQSNQTDSVTITTYYPAPYGVYRNLQLHPSDQPKAGSAAEQPGTMYFNRTDECLYIYNHTAGWHPVEGCRAASAVLCGNGVCDAGETCQNCPADCPCPGGGLYQVCDLTSIPVLSAAGYKFKMSDLTSGCQVYCQGKGYDYKAMHCGDQKTIWYGGGWKVTGFDFRTCQPILGGSHHVPSTTETACESESVLCECQK